MPKTITLHRFDENGIETPIDLASLDILAFKDFGDYTRVRLADRFIHVAESGDMVQRLYQEAL